ncbi:MAG: hypothetical protein KBB37_05210 [Bacteroidia bacterium]|nr:hypothetical protein [Bacteroidia bacterium]MBP7260666.1 hypothetical protein [Bacteroidia bacterium]MBP9181143.1 hypothetical protein [Bacteroidia bacterium]MBP9724308.1 hypothetical protein [Bacteroidia bacterium]
MAKKTRVLGCKKGKKKRSIKTGFEKENVGEVVSIEFSKPRCTIYHFSEKKNMLVVREGIHPPFFHVIFQGAISSCRVFTLLPISFRTYT